MSIHMSHKLRELRHVLVEDSSEDEMKEYGNVPCGWHVEWPDLVIRQSGQGDNRSGLGVFAGRDLRPWEFVPIIGQHLTTAEYQSLVQQRLATHVFSIGASLIDGHPRLRPWAGIGGRGSYVASLVNEPTRCKPNVLIRGSRLVVACPIARGNELLVSYGPLYQRDYLVSRYVYSKQHYAALER